MNENKQEGGTQVTLICYCHCVTTSGRARTCSLCATHLVKMAASVSNLRPATNSLAYAIPNECSWGLVSRKSCLKGHMYQLMLNLNHSDGRYAL